MDFIRGQNTPYSLISKSDSEPVKLSGLSRNRPLVLISIDFDDFTQSPFTPQFLFRLRRCIVKNLRCASYFQLSSRCLDIPMKHCLSCLTYYIFNHMFIEQSTGDFSVSIRNISKDKYQATPVNRSVKSVLSAKIEGLENFNVFESVLEWRLISEMELDTSETAAGTLKSQGTNEWTINRRSIPAGIYQVKFTASYKFGDPASPQTLNAFDYGFIEVIAAPLLAKIDGGSSVRWGSVETVTVDGSLSYDADVGPGNYAGLTFTWSCHEQKEDFTLSIDCFGSFVNLENVNFTTISIDPSHLEIGNTYILRLTVSKDARSSFTEISFEIAAGEVPQVPLR